MRERLSNVVRVSTVALLTCVAVCVATATSTVLAADGNWAVDSSGNWSTATNWSSNPTVPGTVNTDVIGLNNNVTANTTVTIDTTSRTLGTLNIGDSDNTHGFTLAASGGGTLTINGALNETGSTADFISAPVVLSSNLAASVAGSLTMSGVISETGGARTLTKTGAGTLTLSGNNTFTGSITANAGIIRAGANSVSASVGPFGNTNSASIILANTAGVSLDVNGFDVFVKDLQGGGTTGGNVTLGSGTLRLANPASGSSFYGGVISGTGNLVVGGSSRQTFTSSHTYNGTTTVTGSVSFRVSSLADGGIASGIGAASTAASNLVLNSGILEYNNTVAGSTNRLFTLGAGPNIFIQTNGSGAMNFTGTGSIAHSAIAPKTLTLTTSSTGNGTMAPVISDSGTGANITSLTKSGTNTWTLSSNNTYSGGTTINAGTLQANASTALGSGSVSVATGAKLFFNANSLTIANNITLNGTATDGAIYSGDRPAGNVNNVTGNITLNATSNVSSWWNDKTLRLSGNITGAGGLDFVLQPGSVGGRYFLTGSGNNYTGNTSVTGNATGAFGFTGQAMLYVGATNALPTTTALTLTNADLYLNGQSQTLPSISGSGNFSIQNGSTSAASLTLGSGNTTSTFSGRIRDNGISVTNTAASPATVFGTVALSKIGTGTLTLSGNNTYSAGTTISGGVLQANASTAIGNGTVSIASGATLRIGVNGVTLANNMTLNGPTAGGAIDNNAPSAGNVSNLTGTLTLNATSDIATHFNDKTLQLSGQITGPGGLNFVLRSGAVVGGRYLITGATNNYAGATSVTGNATGAFGFTGQAMLYVGATNALPTTSALTLTNADLYLNGQSQALPSISGSGNFSVQNGSTTAATLALGTGNTTSTYSGSIRDNGISVTNTSSSPATVLGTVALTKVGTGMLTLSGSNTYTGATTISGGTLAVNGSLANTPVSVGSTTQLQGSGSIVGAVTVQAGGTLAPGNSIESLGVGALTYSANSTYAYEMDKDAAASVAGDLTFSSGNLSIASGAILTLTELGTGNGTWDIGERLTLVSYNGTWDSGVFTYLGNPLFDGDTFSFSSANWTIDYNDPTKGSNFTGDATGTFVTITVVPEPGTIILLGAGVAFLGLRLARRRFGQEAPIAIAG